MNDDPQKTDSCPAHGCSRVDDGPESFHPQSASCSAAAVAIPVATAQPRPTAQVAIFLCTCNGQDHLVEQLESIARQSWPAWFVALSDDGSTDRTLDIARLYQARWGAQQFSIWHGPQRGFAHNFLSCTRHRKLVAEFYAWCDQDDVWHPDKLTNAVCWLQSVPADIPALYMGRTQLISEKGRHLGHSPRFRRRASFANALVQNIGGGNTMVFNHAARMLLCEADAQLERLSLDVVSHDWWSYLLVTGVGGQVLYDARPYVGYRQHGHNLVGANTGWAARWLRLRQLFRGRFRDWNTTNIAALETLKPRLTNENRARLEQFKKLRTEPVTARLMGVWRTGLYRQTLLGTLGLWLAAVTGVL